MTKDWFRQQNWNPAIETDFFKRLKRAKPTNRAQYVRIQALHLLEADQSHWSDAERLLTYYFEHFPNDLQLAMALEQLGQCREAAGDFDGALSNYKKSIERARLMPSVRPNVELVAARLIALRRIRHEYDFALREIDAWHSRSSLNLPIWLFLAEGSKALIFADRGQTDCSISSARAAMDAAGHDYSGVARHCTIGLADGEHTEMRKRIEGILALPPRKALWPWAKT